MARPASTRSLSNEGRPDPLRSSSSSSNPNVFSDDFAVDRSNSLSDLTPTASVDNRSERLSTTRSSDEKSEPREFVPAGLPGTSFGLTQMPGTNRFSFQESSTHPQRTVSTSSRANTHRTLSTSSHFSLPRAPSPYNGPTAPSHPYGMYNQSTRALSVASESTVRPAEDNFVPQGGPEHPYGMYQQNTVPEEEDDGPLAVPIGFPVLASSSGSASSSSGNDVGDIVGTDGHIEQLPPYSRFADNVIAKGDMARIDPPGSFGTSVTSSDPPDTYNAPSSSSNIELTAMGPSSSDEEVARKEGLSEEKKVRKIFGIPLWTFLVIVAVVIVAALLGGVIGGVVGNKKGTDRAIGSSATTTVWLDADPAQTDGSTGSCPTGHFTLPLNQTAEIDTCIVDPLYTNTWGCLDSAKLGINVFEATNGGPPLSVVFDDYSIRPQLFKYGPQPPDFNGSAFLLEPFKDKEDGELGVALFFSVLFDKLSILPADALSPPQGKKRSIPADQLNRRQSWDDSNWLRIGDQPWYCFWNSTVSEFWIFLDQNIDDLNSAATSSITSGSSSPMTTSPATFTTSTLIAESSTTMNPSRSTPPPPIPTNPSGTGKVKRQATQVGSSGYFPKLVKMVEKRKPNSNVQPYCQQMQVLNNWQIMPIPTVPTICVEESEYIPAASTGSGSKKSKRSPEEIHQMGSNCICEWFSDY